MTTRPPDRMLALDFSGTLSLEAALFARSDNLLRALQESGLWQLGVNSLTAFWEGIVNPTWQEGSTTPIGYTRLLVRQVRQMTASWDQAPPVDVVWAGASRFVEAYLSHSSIDPAWGPVLHQLLRHPGLVIVVATDHYAEATGHILGQLSALGLEGAPVLQTGAQRVLVANSADLGHPKASKGFWAALQAARGLELERIVLIDDLGLHEQPQDSYADCHKVARRREETAQAISCVFAAPTSVFPFLVNELAQNVPSDKEGLLRRYRELVRQAGKSAASALTLGC